MIDKNKYRPKSFSDVIVPKGPSTKYNKPDETLHIDQNRRKLLP
jgi:hypothetical protein